MRSCSSLFFECSQKNVSSLAAKSRHKDTRNESCATVEPVIFRVWNTESYAVSCPNTGQHQPNWSYADSPEETFPTLTPCHSGIRPTFDPRTTLCTTTGSRQSATRGSGHKVGSLPTQRTHRKGTPPEGAHQAAEENLLSRRLQHLREAGRTLHAPTS